MLARNKQTMFCYQWLTLVLVFIIQLGTLCTAVLPSLPSCTNNNEVYSECGTSCRQETCGVKQSDQVCTAQCTEGCFCKDGFVRASISDNNCIPEKSCTMQAKCHSRPNQVWKECGNNCPEKCGEKRPDICTEACRTGCFCEEGYIWFKEKCIHKEQCDAAVIKPTPNSFCATADPNSIWTGCVCDSTCTRKAKYQSKGHRRRKRWYCNKKPCKSGCECKSGFVRYQGTCIDRNTCPKCSGEHEIQDDCFSCPERQCSDMIKPIKHCASLVCEKKCICKLGFIRNDDGVCISRGKCADVLCPGNSKHLVHCNSKKQRKSRTCSVKSSEVSTSVCHKFKCVCRNRHLYSKEKQGCVRRTQCKRKMKPKRRYKKKKAQSVNP